MVARADKMTGAAVGMVTLRDGAFGAAHPAATTLTTDVASMRVRSVISTADADRAGDIIVPTGLRNQEDFMQNPVVLWAHNRIAFPPIGLCEWLDVQPNRIVAETRFAQGVPFAEDVFRLYEQQILRGWSIGFVPRKARRIPGPGGQSSLRVEEWELLEYSAVPIPENPGALTVALQKGLVRDQPLREWLERIPDERGGGNGGPRGMSSAVWWNAADGTSVTKWCIRSDGGAGSGVVSVLREGAFSCLRI